MSTPETAPRSDLDALFEIALTLNSIQEPGVLMEKVLEAAMGALGADRGFVLLNSETERAGFEIRTSKNFSEEQLGDVVRISTSVVHRVLQTGEPVMVHEALQDERFSGAESIVAQHIQSISCVPLRLKSRQIGAIYMDCLTDRRRFRQDNLPFLEAFSNLAAVAIENARLYQTLRDENRQLRNQLTHIHGFTELIGQSDPMRRLYAVMERVLDNDATVLIEGESGTGKELVARAIHYNGHRQTKPFLALFCGSLPDNLLESELFGYKKGAFTGAVADKAGLFEAADGGTLFLDEVGDLSPSLQTALLRVLQEGEVKRIGETHVRYVDVRILSATNKPLKQLIKEGSFREDLFYRLNTISLTTPPLRDRGEDIPLLAHFFLDKYAVGRREHIQGFSAEAIASMQAHSWPGNVRELQNTVERAVVMAMGNVVELEDLQLPAGEKPLKRTYHAMLAEGQSLADIEKQVVLETMKETDGNVSETARRLGVSRGWIHNRLKEWNVPTS